VPVRQFLINQQNLFQNLEYPFTGRCQQLANRGKKTRDIGEAVLGLDFFGFVYLPVVKVSGAR